MNFTWIVSIHIIPEGSKTLFCDLLNNFWEQVFIYSDDCFQCMFTENLSRLHSNL